MGGGAFSTGRRRFTAKTPSSPRRWWLATRCEQRGAHAPSRVPERAPALRLLRRPDTLPIATRLPPAGRPNPGSLLDSRPRSCQKHPHESAATAWRRNKRAVPGGMCPCSLGRPNTPSVMPSEQQVKTFRCRPSPKVMLLCGLFFGACAAVLGHKASTNTKGLVLDGIIGFGPAGASAFYWVLTALSILFVLAAGWTIFTTLVHGVPDVVLTGDAISFPAGFPIKRSVRLSYSDITGLSRSEVNGQRFLTLHTATKKHHMVLNWLGSKDAEAALTHELARRLSGAGTTPRT
jgi:hypothetical protein